MTLLMEDSLSNKRSNPIKSEGTVLAIVLLSGGLDSAVSLYWALKKGFKVQTLGFNYFHRNKKEIDAAKKLARLNKVNYREIRLDFLREIEDSAQARNDLLEEAERAYIPSRNVIFYGIASYIAEIVNARYIVGGHNRDDVKSFPDSSADFFSRFNAMTSVGLMSGARTGRVILPLAKLSKVDVIKLGNRLKVPFRLTWSCSRSAKTPCGKCHSCTLRKKSFEEAGLDDPISNSLINS
jgi:7-cyano-7-deazaguanine synthase